MKGEEGFKYFLKKLIGSKEFPFAESNWEKMKAMLPDEEKSGEEQFKDSLKSLLETKEFEFDEGNWKKMKALLPEKEEKNRLVPILLSALGLLLIGVLGFLFGISREREIESHQPAVVSRKLPTVSRPSQEQTRENRANQKIRAPKTETKEVKTEKALENPVKAKNTFPKKTKPSETIIYKDIQPAEDEKVKTGVTVPDVLVPVTVNITDKKEDAKKSEIASDEKQQTKVTSEMLVSEKIAETMINNTTTSTISEEKNEVAVQPEIKQEEVVKQELSNEATKENLAVKNLTEEIKPALTSDSVAAVKRDTAAVSKDSAQVTDKVANIELPKTNKPVMYFEAGGAYLFGWKNEGKREGNGLNPVVGFNYYNYLNEKFAISLGAQYMSVNNLSYYSNTSKKITRYGFGEESDVTVITPQKIHYFIVPIKVNYFLDSNNTFGAGFNVGYLLTIDSKVETYTMHLNSKLSDKTYTASGYTEGFRAFDSQFCVFYRRRLYKNLGINAELFLGLSDVKNNGFFNSNVKERNRGLKLTLTYTILK